MNQPNGRANIAEMRRLWRHIYGKGAGFLCVASGDRTGDRLENVRHEYFPYPDRSKAAAEHALRESGRGREVYHGVHLLKQRSRVKESAAQVRSLWADLDGTPVPENPKPTAVIESSPGRFHAYWRLNRPLDPEQAESLNRRLTYDIGADKGKWALATLLRPPQTTNHKRLGAPTRAAVVSLDPGREYDPDDLGALAEPGGDGNARNGHPSGTTTTTEPPVRLEAAGLRVWRGESPKLKSGGEIDRSASLYKMAAILARAGATERVIAESLQERDETLSWRKYTDRGDGPQQYRALAAKATSETAPEGGHDAPSEPDEPAFNRTDLGNAERLAARHGKDLRYSHKWKCYLVWDGKRWKRDTSGEVERRAVETVRAIYDEAKTEPDPDVSKALGRHAIASESRSRIEAMISLARSRPGMPVEPEHLDADPWLINVENGTINLKTGELRPHDREDLITRLVPVEFDPEAQAPRFERFLSEVFAGDQGLIGFVQRLAGYTLTGSTEERVFAILHGKGKNGKTTLVELLRDVLGEYARNTAVETILQKDYQGVGNDVAALCGARLVTAAEVEQGRRLAESKVKNLTGSDTVTARFLFSEPFDFKPQFKLWLSTNNKPEIWGTDDAIWDRIRLIPFGQRFVGDRRDPQLPEKLRGEMPGVLAWMVRGCLEWRRQGLGVPKKIREATADYKTEMDVLAAFIEERCVVHPNASVGATPLWEAYRSWCDDNGEHKLTRTKFGLRVGERFHKEKTQTVTYYGIGLRSDKPDPGGGGSPYPGPDDGPVEGSGDDSGSYGGGVSPDGGSNPLTVEGSGSNPLDAESPIGKLDSGGRGRGLDSCRGLSENLGANISHVRRASENPLNPLNPLRRRLLQAITSSAEALAGVNYPPRRSLGCSASSRRG